jgi:hypothetical protein
MGGSEEKNKAPSTTPVQQQYPLTSTTTTTTSIMSGNKIIVTLLLSLLALCFHDANAFTLTESGRQPTTSLSAVSRRAWLDASAAAAASFVLSGSSLPAFADDDLAMPTEAEAKATAVSAMLLC